MKDERAFRRGEIYLADLGTRFGSEQGGIRPVLILQNNLGNIYCPTLIVAPLTTQTGKKPNQPTHYKLAGDGKAIRPSTVLLEQITTIDKRRVLGSGIDPTACGFPRHHLCADEERRV